ncbi:hypothetical protein AVEN_138516-1 [Araneus ventricosus]|uniref:Uncharacterized protein n=1 Tax=Araneus ventricosus TaxID=182803 RepID=A0A4Y2RKA3_ARAVE|nr:hypothetical protein AVEN_138516-1 [Araneus ventricosus]
MAWLKNMNRRKKIMDNIVWFLFKNWQIDVPFSNDLLAEVALAAGELSSKRYLCQVSPNSSRKPPNTIHRNSSLISKLICFVSAQALPSTMRRCHTCLLT